jgi:Tol biopolymer transport system component
MRQTSGAGDTPRSEISPSDRLDSWKEIAAHLRRAVRTVRRWEQCEGLPVHRHPHAKRSSVYAYRTEIDAWWSSRQANLNPHSAVVDVPTGGGPTRRPWSAAIVPGVLSLAFVGLMAARLLQNGNGTKAPLVRSLTAYHGFETGPSFSPDGTRLAFVWNGDQMDNFDIYVRMIDDSTSHRLTTSPATDYNPVWSPDGRAIAFLRWREGSRADIWVMPSLGGSERKIGEATPGDLNDPLLAWISHLAWSHDSRSLIVADADPESRTQSLFKISTDTGEKRRITRALTFSMGDDSPSVSADGRTLAFVRSPTIAASDIYLLPLTVQMVSESTPRRLTFENGYLYNPMWTSDGRDILYVTYLDGNTVIKRIPVQGGGQPEVVFTVGQRATSTALSPDGGRLVYAAAQDDLDIAVLSLNGDSLHPNPPHRLISSTRTDMSPQISPDGTRIAFASRRSGPMEIWVADRDGKNPVRLTQGLLYSGAPRWSPDAKMLAFGSVVNGKDDIFTVGASGGPVRRITEDPARDVVASWSRDGHSLYFASNRTGSFEIWKMPIRGGPARQITKGGGYGGFESVDGGYFYYAKSNTMPTSLWRVSVNGGDEQSVIPSLHRWSHFAVFQDGIYFVPSIRPPARSELQFYAFDSRSIQSVANLQAHTAPGLAISPDRRWALYVVHERVASDLMLLESFR